MSPELNQEQFPLLVEIRDFFIKHARDIQMGHSQYCPSHEWLGITWPVDEYIMIKLVREGTLDQFYAEAEQLLFENVIINRQLLHQSFILGKALLKLPFRTGEHIVECNWNILEVYQGVRVGKFTNIKPDRYHYRINWDSNSWDSWERWCKEVVWWCNRSGNYFLGPDTIAVEPVPPGHH